MILLITIFKSPFFLLCLIVVFGFWFRLYRLDSPIADWHSWRQADTAAVARNFYKDGFNPFLPQGDDMSAISEQGLVNLNRYRMVEFPITNSLTYLLYILNNGVDERLARLISIVFSLGSVIFIYLITKRYFQIFTALVAAFLFAFLPYNIYYSRVILPEPALVFFSLGMFYFIDKWIYENKISQLFLSIIFMSLAFLTKPMAVFYLLPLIYSYWLKEKTFWPVPLRYFWLVLGLIPFGLWRLWINQFPEGIPASSWLFNGNNIRFKPAFWRWIVGDRLGREILSVAGLPIFIIGILSKTNLNEKKLLHILGLASLLYLIVFATGNVQHDYYQILIIPAIVIFTARGLVKLLTGIPSFFPKIITIPIGLFLVILSFYLCWFEIKGLYQINNPTIVHAGKIADNLLPKDAVVLAPYQGDTAFLYQTNRHGFPVTITSIEEMRDKYGVGYYISVTKDDETNEVMKKYQTLIDSPEYVIVDLSKKNTLP